MDNKNFYGVINVTRCALPIMRKQRSGYIFQISPWRRLAVGQYRLPCCQVGGWRIYRISSTGSRAFWRQGVCPRTRGNADKLGVRANKETPVLLSEL